MSLLSAILEEAHKADSEDLKKHKNNVLSKYKDFMEKVQMLSFALQQNFVDTHFNFTITKSLEQINYKNRKKLLFADYENLNEDIKTLHEKFRFVDEEFENNCKKLKDAFGKLEDLCVVVEGTKEFDRTDHEFRRYNYSNAILSIKKLQDQLKDLNFEGDAGTALSNMKAQAENHVAIYTAQLCVEWDDLFEWDEKKGLNYLTFSLSVQQSDPELIQKVLKTLYEVNYLNAQLATFSHFFITKLVHSIINHKCVIFTEDSIGALVYNIKIDLNDKNKPHYQTILTNLTAIFEFLQTTLGSHLPEFIPVFSKSTGNNFFNMIIDECIRNNLPSCDSSYENFKNLAAELSIFNKFLIDLKYVNTTKSPLSEFIDDTERVLYIKKCNKLLSDVRDLLNESLSYGTIEVGSDTKSSSESITDLTAKETWDINKPIFLPRCLVSNNIKQLMTMIIEHLNESTKLPEIYGKLLVKYIKKIAVLYQAIVRKKFKVNLEHCPLDIALFFNNCFYLAHGLVGPPWKLSLPSAIADQLAIELLECIQDLRMEGLEKVSLYLQKQKNIITLNIESHDSLIWTADIFDEFDIAVNRVVTMLKYLKTNWYNVLPIKMYELSICSLIQVVCQTILSRVLTNMKPTSEDVVYMVAVRLDDLVKEFTELFEEPIDLKKTVNVWAKFIKLPILLKAHLLETVKLWENCKEISESYSCEEVRQIIKIRFPDNIYRLKILNKIQ